LRKLQRDGEAVLALPPFLTPTQEALWEVRVWRCLDKIAHHRAFEAAMQRDQEDIGEIDLLDPDSSRSADPARISSKWFWTKAKNKLEL